MLLADIMAQQGRELLGAAAPSDIDRKLIGLTIVSGGVDLTAMWLNGDLGVGRDHFTDFFTGFIQASIHMPASLDQSAGSSTAAGLSSAVCCRANATPSARKKMMNSGPPR